jgi:hypothetical protein
MIAKKPAPRPDRGWPVIGKERDRLDALDARIDARRRVCVRCRSGALPNVVHATCPGFEKTLSRAPFDA